MEILSNRPPLFWKFQLAGYNAATTEHPTAANNVTRAKGTVEQGQRRGATMATAASENKAGADFAAPVSLLFSFLVCVAMNNALTGGWSPL